MVICLERGADLHMAQLMPLPLTVFCFSKIQVGLTFLVPAHLGSPRKEPLNGWVCVCVCACACAGVLVRARARARARACARACTRFIDFTPCLQRSPVEQLHSSLSMLRYHSSRNIED